ncbi:MAG: SLBB domain-containing protein, partial [Gallionellaceae bacterium]|nr:SLBB domain-containing protein [Gallionellaceae bacterium]
MFPNTPLGAAAGLGGGMGLPGNGGMMIPGNGMVLRGSDPGAVDVCAVMPNSDACRQKTASSAPEQNKRILPPEPPSEFQRFISASAQEILPMYGYSLFNEPPDTFAPVDNIPVTPDYMIGPGDELVIKGWGQVDIDVRAVVNRNGEINLPQVGTINVAGVHYEDLQPYLKNAVGRVFRNFDLSVTLGTLRSIQVFVVGQARSPGTYTVSSLSTLVNALFVSGGPSKKGSMRHIQVKRNGKVVTEFDLYDLLLNGDKTKDVSLQPGDVIYIPPVGNLVAISGSVNNPAIYELKDGEATLASLIEMGGGLTTTAFGQKARIERIENRGGRAVAEFSLDQSGMARAIKDGDYVYVMPIDARFDNAVTLRGSVAHPGRYPWREGMRVRDLIPNMDALITPGYWNEQNLAEEGGRWIDAEDGQSSVLQDGRLPGGQTKRAGRNEQKSSVRPEERYSASEINLDYAVIERLDKSDLTTSLIPFNLGKALKGDDRQNLPLQPGDTIRVFAR